MTIFKQNNEIISRINQLNKFQSKILGKHKNSTWMRKIKNAAHLFG